MTPLSLRRWSLRLVMFGFLAFAGGILAFAVTSTVSSTMQARAIRTEIRELSSVAATLESEAARAEALIARSTLAASDPNEARSILQTQIADAFANRGGRLVTLRLDPEGEDRVTALVVWQGDEAGARAALEALNAVNLGAVVSRLSWRRIDGVADIDVELELRLVQAWSQP